MISYIRWMHDTFFSLLHHEILQKCSDSHTYEKQKTKKQEKKRKRKRDTLQKEITKRKIVKAINQLQPSCHSLILQKYRAGSYEYIFERFDIDMPTTFLEDPSIICWHAS